MVFNPHPLNLQNKVTFILDGYYAYRVLLSAIINTELFDKNVVCSGFNYLNILHYCIILPDSLDAFVLMGSKEEDSGWRKMYLRWERKVTKFQGNALLFW